MPIGLRITLAAVCALFVRTATARAQAPATQPAGTARASLPPARWLQIEQLSFDLGFDARYERRQVITERSGRYGLAFRQLNEQRTFEETIGFATYGTFLDERFMRFDLSARWGLSQERFFESRPGPDLTQRPHGDILEYDFSIDLFPAGRISASVFGSQRDDRIPRPFLPSLDRRRERYGATLLFNDRRFPMRLTYEHTRDLLRGGFDRLDNEDFGRDTLQYEATWQISDYHSLRFEYEYDDRQERFSGLTTNFDTRRHYFTLDHALRFGPDHEHSLDTLIRYQDEAGDLARDTIEFAPRLRIRHSRSLTTTYGAQYLEDTFQDFRVRQWRGDISVIHQFGEHLTNTFNFYGLRQDTEDLGHRGGGIDSSDWGGTANFAYARDNRWGRFSANLSYTHSRTRTSDDRQGGLVFGEAVTFRDPRPTFLAHTNVYPFSIVVTDLTHTRVFVAGRDYVVARVGRFTALQRVRTGQIEDGQTVLVSYRYQAFGDYEISRDRVDLRVQQDFRFGLSAYYAGSIQDEDLSRSAFQTFGARNVNRHRVGLTYRRTRWSVGLELESNEETIDPFDAFHLNADMTFLEDARQQLSGRGRLSRFWFGGSDGLLDRNTTLLDLGLSYRYLLGTRLEASASADYRFETDSLFGRTQGVDLTGSVAYRMGLFSVLVEVEYDLLDLPNSSDNTFAVWVKLRREIPLIGQARGPDWARWARN